MSGTEQLQKILQTNAWTNEVPWLDREEADIDGYIASLDILPDYDLRSALYSWRQEGVVVLKGAVSERLISEYLADIADLMRNFVDYEIPIEIRGNQLSSRDLEGFPEDMIGVKLNQMHCFSRAAAGLSLSARIADFLGHVFEGPASVCQSLTFWRGSEQPIHIDYPYVRQQTKLAYLAASWIPLEDINPMAGPLAYYPGGHKIEHSGFFDWGGGSIVYDENSTRTPSEFAEYLYDRMARCGIERQDFCPLRGDALIWHGNLPHEGTAVKDISLTRKSYVTHYTAEQTLPDWMRNFDATGNPIGLFANGANSWRYRWFDESRVFPGWNEQFNV